MLSVQRVAKMTELLCGRYRILEAIGSGGCGQAFLVEDTHMPSKRRCVIKQLKPVAKDEATRRIIAERFNREAVILEELGHLSDQIPDLFDFFTENEEFYLVQEWIAGETLQERIYRAGVMAEADTRHILTSLLLLLEKVHANGIIHRDIKPNNVVLRTRDGLPVLIDFGAVKDLYAAVVTPDAMTSSSIVIGSPGFMSLEQTAGRPVFASDLYSLGLTAIYLLTGKQPKDLTDKTTGEIHWRTDAAHISRELTAILARATRSAPGERFQSAGEMLAALTEDEATRVVVRQVQPLEQINNNAGEFAEVPERRVWPVWVLAGFLGAFCLAGTYFYRQKSLEAVAAQSALFAANQELNEAREAKSVAEKRAKNAEEKARKTEQATKQIWRVATLNNQTDRTVSYDVLNPDGGWDTYTIEPAAARTHWRLNTEILVKFNESNGFLRREKMQPLRGASTVLGHEPNEEEQNRAKSFYFKLDES